MTELEIIAALSERNVVALTLFGEVRNEPILGILAVACVIRNRVAIKYRGTTYREVCLAPWQFSCWKKEGGAANHAALMAMAESLVSGDAAKDGVFAVCAYVAGETMRGVFRDRVGSCRHYYAAGTPEPAWAKGKTPAYTVGHHLFFEGIA